MSNKGWIKLHRHLMDKAIWTDSTPEHKTILITLLMMANHKVKEWEWKGEKYVAKPGQFVTSLEKIAINAGKGVSIQNVRTALKKFEKYGFLTNESTNKNRLITIENWESYQCKDEEVTSNQQATNKQLTTNKNVKNDKNINYIYEYWNSKKIITHRKLTKKMETKIKSILKDYSIEEIKEAIDNYAEIVLDDKYWFTHRWTIEEFIQRGFEKFQNRDIAIQNYLKKECGNKNKSETIESSNWRGTDRRF